MLGVAIGASTVDPLAGDDAMRILTTGSAVWLGLSLAISSYIGGWTAGKLAEIPRKLESALHGAVSWAAVNLAAFLLAGTILGSALSGFTLMATSVVSAEGGRPLAADAVAGGEAGMRDEATAILQDIQNRVQGLNAAPDNSVQAARAAAGTGWGIVIVMFLGLVAGITGAATAAPRPYYESRRIG